MSKCVLVGVNAKYVHTNLAIRSLKAAAPGADVELCEVTINDQLNLVVGRLLRLQADYYGFSCYIWNMEMVSKISEVLKKSRPNCVVFWGGPEVSYDSGTLLEDHPFVDYIISGEGETVFPAFVKTLESRDKTPLLQMDNVNWFGRDVSRSPASGEKVGIVEALDTLPFPYDEENIRSVSDKIIYYESMRGCPFQCSYCLSSTLQSVRFLPLERVFRELDFFISHRVKQVKFVDRTFNVDIRRTKAIIAYLAGKECDTNFHFEIAGDLLDDELLEMIAKAPKGLMQFEIGIQSTNDETLEAITRKTDLDKIRKYVKRLIGFKNCHVHVDLIAGLPKETYAVFKKSFNETIAIEPDMLQLGFLKLLKGTKIRREADKFYYRYASFPPYEVISNDFITSEELLRLKDIEELVDRYYNSGAFFLSLKYIFENQCCGTPFEFFEALSAHWRDKGCYEVGKSKEQLYSVLQDFTALGIQPPHRETLGELIKMDYLRQGYRSLPGFFENRTLSKTAAFEQLKDEAFVDICLPMFSGQPAKQVIKQVFFQYFEENALDLAQRYLDTEPGRGSLCVFYEGKLIRVAE
ncbi:B12-binding domain-containing radical SAM protein [Eubacterium sp. 1001713B170207_170306_E7]|uniref:B12-binding domain-containing radical SAM protein n=1 Tax=Eubacterium sp. 1001713B170207_170306_E7 TaxID=2787097 RepID=UPI00189AEFD6|nr:B12-binding domain-containing radical SAM protein [Eubacterium sp. 1001713B170207_170306_E7]